MPELLVNTTVLGRGLRLRLAGWSPHNGHYEVAEQVREVGATTAVVQVSRGFLLLESVP